MSEADEPEWDEATQRFDGGLAGVSVLQIAALRNNDAAMCACLLAHGVDSASLTADAPPALRDAAHAAASDNTLARPDLAPKAHRPMKRVISSPRAKPEKRFFKRPEELGRRKIPGPSAQFHGSRGAL